MEIRHLRALCALASAGSVTRAAAELGTTQPSLTTLLQRIERQVGEPLFRRERAGVVPTPLGEQVVRRAAASLAEFDHLQVHLAEHRSTAVLGVGLSVMECTTALIAELEHTLGDERDLRYAVDTSTAVLAHGLAHHHHDLAVVLVSDDAEHQVPPGLGHRVVLPTIPVFVGIAASHPLAAREEIDLADLAGEAWIEPPGADDGSLAELRTAALDAGFDPEVRFTFPYGGGRPLIATGLAVQLVEPLVVPPPGVVVRPLVGDPVRMRVIIAWRRERVGRSMVEATYRAVLSTYGDQARRSEVYRSWWQRRREEHAWAAQLDPVFAEAR